LGIAWVASDGGSSRVARTPDCAPKSHPNRSCGTSCLVRSLPVEWALRRPPSQAAGTTAAEPLPGDQALVLMSSSHGERLPPTRDSKRTTPLSSAQRGPLSQRRAPPCPARCTHSREPRSGPHAAHSTGTPKPRSALPRHRGVQFLRIAISARAQSPCSNSGCGSSSSPPLLALPTLVACRRTGARPHTIPSVPMRGSERPHT
jgi:hypothetical protein